MSLNDFLFAFLYASIVIVFDGFLHIAMIKFCPKIFWNLYHEDILKYFEDKFIDERIEKL